MKYPFATILVLLTFFLSFTILGCATKTYYVLSEDNGYSEQKVGEDVYQIRVKSRNIKDKKRLQDLFYLRAAELTRDSGYRYFFTVEKMEDLTGMEGKAKPFKQRILIAIVYEDIIITGLVKFLPEQRELAVNVYDAEVVYRKNYYLIKERDAIFASTNSVTNVSQAELAEPTKPFDNGVLETSNTNNLEVVEELTTGETKPGAGGENPQEQGELLEINLFDIE